MRLCVTHASTHAHCLAPTAGQHVLPEQRAPVTSGHGKADRRPLASRGRRRGQDHPSAAPLHTADARWQRVCAWYVRMACACQARAVHILSAWTGHAQAQHMPYSGAEWRSLPRSCCRRCLPSTGATLGGRSRTRRRCSASCVWHIPRTRHAHATRTPRAHHAHTTRTPRAHHLHLQEDPGHVGCAECRGGRPRIDGERGHLVASLPRLFFGHAHVQHDVVGAVQPMAPHHTPAQGVRPVLGVSRGRGPWRQSGQWAVGRGLRGPRLRLAPRTVLPRAPSGVVGRGARRGRSRLRPAGGTCRNSSP